MQVQRRCGPHLVLALGLSASLGCSFILDPSLDDEVDAGEAADLGGAGSVAFGGACARDLDCKAGLCSDGRCTQNCSADTPCPGGLPSQCRQGLCRFVTAPALKGPPKVGFLYVGPVGDHGWTLTHEKGRQYLASPSPASARTTRRASPPPTHPG